MSVNLENVLKNIQTEKNTKLLPENIRKGVTALGVQGTLQPVTVPGGGIGKAIYLQDTTPVDPNGIWINTDKSYDKVYLENERYTNEHSILFSNADTTDPSNVIANHTNNGLDLSGATYAQKNNVVHFFGFFNNRTTSQNTTPLVHRHWKYDFDTNTWTQLSDCPTPQGGIQAVWVGDYIYIFGTTYNGTTNSDYKQYAYKYNTTNDTWERIADLPTVKSTLNDYGLGCAYDNNDNIYIIGCYYGYKYSISTGSYTAISSPGAVLGYKSVYYYDNYIYTLPVKSTGSARMQCYNIITNVWNSSYGPNVSTYVGTSGMNLGGMTMVNNKLYCFSGSSNYHFNPAVVDDYDNNNNWGWISTEDATQYAKITNASNPYSSRVRNINGGPVCVFATDRGSIILFFGGITSGTTLNIDNQMGILLNDKDYTDLEDNTLIIYTTDGVMGTYTTSIYLDEQVTSGKIYQKFNDVNLWDATNQTLIKNLHTYYGDGTNWIQIK